MARKLADNPRLTANNLPSVNGIKQREYELRFMIDEVQKYISFQIDPGVWDS